MTTRNMTLYPIQFSGVAENFYTSTLLNVAEDRVLYIRKLVADYYGKYPDTTYFSDDIKVLIEKCNTVNEVIVLLLNINKYSRII